MASQVAPVHRFSIEDVTAMVAAGILDERARVELVDGVLVEMSPIGPRDGSVVQRLMTHFVKASDDDAFSVRVQDTLRTRDGGFVQPDLMCFEPLAPDRQPTTALLVIEVSDSSLARDHEKAATYAAAGVPEYWIVDVERDELLVHREPTGGSYRTVKCLLPGDTVAPLVDAPPVDVAALLIRAG